MYLDDQEDKEENPPDDSLAGETGELNKQDTLQDRLSRYKPLKTRNLDMVDYIISQPSGKNKTGQIKTMTECGEFLLFRNYYTIEQIRLHKANFCKNHLLCPLCALRRAVKYLQAYLKKFESIKTQHPEIKPYLVTFTVRNGPDLRERTIHLMTSMKRLKKRRYDAEKRKRPLMQINKALGGVEAYEFKKGSGSKEWHPHCHGIWLCTDRPWHTEAQEEWKDITGDSFMVNLRPFDEDKPYFEGFMEVFRYALKSSTMTIPEQYEAAQVLRGKRLINSFGVFRGVVVPESLEDEPIDDKPFIELLYQFIKSSGYHFKHLDPRR